MGFFGTVAGHTDDGDDEAGLTWMISNSRIPDNYEPGRFHLFRVGVYVIVKPKIASIFSRLSKHSGTPPIALKGAILLAFVARLMIVFYCPKAILSPDRSVIPWGTRVPRMSNPRQGTEALQGAEVRSE